jgi:HSP20 family protein
VPAPAPTTGTFERSIRLPEYVDGEHIGAEFTNGLLTISVPKAQAAQPRRIEIKAGSNENPQITGNSNGSKQTSSK